MFLNGIIYEYSQDTSIGKSWANFKRMEKCGNWVTVNAIHAVSLRKRLAAHVYFSVNVASGYVVLAFKGSGFDTSKSSIASWISNFSGVRKNYPFVKKCGKVHGSYLNNVAAIANPMLTQIDLFLKAGYKIAVTGHSRGAAFAVIFGPRVVTAFPKYRHVISVITIGAPRVGNSRFASCYSRIIGSSTRHFITSYPGGPVDLVTTVPPKILGFKNTPGKRTFVKCNSKYFNSSRIPKSIGCHLLRSYIDGLIHEGTSNSVFRKQTKKSTVAVLNAVDLNMLSDVEH